MKMKQREIPPLKKARWSTALLLAGFLLGSLLPSLNWQVQAAPRQAVADHIVISEFRTSGPNGNEDEFIELYNPTNGDIDISGWEIHISDDSGSTSPYATIPLLSILTTGQHYLLVNSTGYLGGYDHNYTTGIPDTGGIALIASSVEIDKVGMDAGSAYYENTPLSPLPSNTSDQSYERKLGGNDGNHIDTDNNEADFIHNDGSSSISNPQTSSDAAIYPPLSVVINEVAWAGTEASSDDEWIEIYSPGRGNFDLTGWRLVAEDGSPDIILSGVTSANGYFLLEREHRGVVENVPGFDGAFPDDPFDSNQVYSGALDDINEVLRLRAPYGTIIDTANGNGGAWPNGRLSPASSMERMSLDADSDDIWVTNPNEHPPATDLAGDPIYGSPAEENWGNGLSHTPTPPPVTSLTIVINEVAWAGAPDGTNASTDDEWIELFNSSSVDVDLTNWQLKAGDNAPTITFLPSTCVSISCIIPAKGYYLLENDNDTTVDNIAADLIYSGSLEDGGEYLQLISSTGDTVDTANKKNGAWPAGTSSSDYRSMERSGVVVDSPSTWFTFMGTVRNGLDADGNPINGTPREANWAYSVIATPSPVPTRTPIPPSATPTPYPFQSVVLNEVLPRPGYDWNDDGVVNAHDEYIEIINRGSSSINLQGWKLDDEYNLGSLPYTLPSVNLAAGERIAIFGYTSHIALSDGGDTVRLLKNNGQIADVITYTVIKVADQSWCRYPEDSYWRIDCFPTPNEENSLQGKSGDNLPTYTRPACSVPDTVPEIISFIECGDWGININDANFWNRDLPEIWLTGHAKNSTWFR